MAFYTNRYFASLVFFPFLFCSILFFLQETCSIPVHCRQSNLRQVVLKKSSLCVFIGTSFVRSLQSRGVQSMRHQ